ncbi:hypothetical protein BGZ60DRAFT_415357 [Tricladium varicosporioides]|nr:hypothetical protein BGZ60DRAFT_415357 [Hymenoscyphus varicosporioides]
MSGFKDIAKGGWHPKGKDGKSKESWRGDNKGIDQIAGWMGKKKDPTAEAYEHVSRPLTSLKDPAAFGPPPKNINYHGGAALPNQITPDRQGLGAPISRDEIQAKKQQEDEEAQREEEEAAKPKPPPVPYRADKTGLSTSHLPPPPGRKDGADGRGPPPVADKPKAKPPGLPPRLPPRQTSNPTPTLPPPYNKSTPQADSHKDMLNQGALNRLGAAGVSVPGFDIGETKRKPPLPPPSPISPQNSPITPSYSNNSQLNELQSRFSRLSSKSPKLEPATEGTTWAQKQAALKTASSFRNDPSSVSLSDAKAAAGTANNFRERHGEQVKSGWQSANRLNTKYGIADKVGAYGGIRTQQSPQSTSPSPLEQHDSGPPQGASRTPEVAGLARKKPPPPPPKKRPELTSSSVTEEPAPPPIPMASKPKPKLLDLDLPSLWFAQSPPAFPPPCITRGGKTSCASKSGWGSNGVRKTHWFTGVIQHNADLSRTTIHLTWDGSNPGLTVKAEQRYTAPPREIGGEELEASRERYSDAVAKYCEGQMGNQVGDGECWTLANEALKFVAATCASRGQEPCMTSQSYIHGHILYTFIPTTSPFPIPRGGISDAGVAKGDIVQLLSAHFKGKDGSQKWAGAPDHTAVITDVGQDAVLEVLEQNVGGVKRVVRGRYDMSELVKGEVRIFRAVGQDWLPPLDPNW